MAIRFAAFQRAENRENFSFSINKTGKRRLTRSFRPGYVVQVYKRKSANN